MNADNRPLVFSLLTILMWGLWGFFGKLALERRMAPTAVFLAEALVGALIAVPLFLVVAQRQGAPSLPNTLNIYGLLSGATLAVGLLFYYLALEGANVSVVVPLTATYPVVAVLLGYAFLGERLSLSQLAGVVLVVAGAALLLSGPAKGSGN